MHGFEPNSYFSHYGTLYLSQQCRTHLCRQAQTSAVARVEWKRAATVLTTLEENTAMTPAPLIGCEYNRNYSERILGAFAKLREETISLCSHWTNFQEMMIFEKSVKKVNLIGIVDDLHEDLCSFMRIFWWILLRMRIVSDKRCRDDQNTHFNSWRMKDQLDVTCYFISLLMCSTYFGH